MADQTKERTDVQIADDLAPLTATQQMEAQQLKRAMFDALANGKYVAPAPAVYTEQHREAMHDAFVLLTLRLEHVENQLRHFTKAIQPRPGEPLPPAAPLKKPDPLDPRTARIKELLDGGATLEEAGKQAEKEGL